MTAPAIPTVEQLRDAPVTGPLDLWNYLFLFHGVKLANRCVCPEHSSPWVAFKRCYFDPPAQAMIIGPRGGGKSFMAGLRSHRRSRDMPRHRTRILGGSLAQSGQIQDAIKIAVLDGKGPHGWDDSASIREALAQKIKYVNGSEVEILAASTKSVRGPHVPDLNLDEIDEMDRDVQQAAVGMAMDSAKFGIRSDGLWGELPDPVKSTILMTSTWHRPDGPVGEMLAKAEELNAKRPGTFPVFKFCSFDVLERCPEERSGRHLEHCSECPIRKWCHELARWRTAECRAAGHAPGRTAPAGVARERRLLTRGSAGGGPRRGVGNAKAQAAVRTHRSNQRLLVLHDA